MSEEAVRRDRYRIEALARGLQVLMLFDGSDRPLKTSWICRPDRRPHAHHVSRGVHPGGHGLPRARARTTAPCDRDWRSSAWDRPLSATLQPGGGERPTLASPGRPDRGDHQPRRRQCRPDAVRSSDGCATRTWSSANVAVGTTLPKPYTSMEELLLAHLGDDDIAQRLKPASFPAGAGPNAVRDLDELMSHVRRIRDDGYSIQDQELAQGLRSISVAVLSRDGAAVAALNVAVAAYRHRRGLARALLPRTTEGVRRRDLDEVAGRMTEPPSSAAAPRQPRLLPGQLDDEQAQLYRAITRRSAERGTPALRAHRHRGRTPRSVRRLSSVLGAGRRAATGRGSRALSVRVERPSP